MARRRRPQETLPPEVEPEETRAVVDEATGVSVEPSPAADDPDEPELLQDDDMPEADLDGGVELPSPADPMGQAPRFDLGSPAGFDNRIPIPPIPMPQSQDTSPFAPQEDPYRQAGSPYDQEGDPLPVRPPQQPRRDGEASREARDAFSGFESDVLVSIKVEYEDPLAGGQMVYCGHLYRITMERARNPGSYILDFDGTFWITMYHAGQGPGIGRQIGNSFAHHSSGSPFVRGWRVGMDINQMVNDGVAKVLASMGIAMPQGGVAQQQAAPFGGQVPTGVFNGQVGWFQQQIAEMNNRIKDAEDRARRAEEDRRMEQIVGPLKETINRLEAKLNDGGGNSVLAKVIEGQTRLAEAAMNRDNKSGFGEAIELFRMTQGPEAMGAMAAVNKMVVDNLVQMVKTAKGGDEKFNIKELMEAYEKFNKGQLEQKKEERAWLERKMEKEQDREAAQKRESDDRKARERVAVASISRSTDAMIIKIRDAMAAKEPPNEIGMMANILYTSLIAFKWANESKDAGEMGMEMKTNPEGAFTRFAMAAGIGANGTVSDDDARYIGMCAAHFRNYAGLGQREASPEPKKQVEPPSRPAATDPANTDAGARTEEQPGVAPATPPPNPQKTEPENPAASDGVAPAPTPQDSGPVAATDACP